MSHPVLSKADRDAIFTLIHFKEPATNKDLDARCKGSEIYGKQRKRLEDLGLIASHKVTSPKLTYSYELTDAGWQWIEDELAAPVPSGADRTSRVYYPFHNVLARFMRRTGTTMADLFAEDAETDSEVQSGPDVEKAILAAYDDAAEQRGDWVPLWKIRNALPELPRPEVDKALGDMFIGRKIRLIPEVNRKALTPEDEAAAVHVGGDDKHFIGVEAQ